MWGYLPASDARGFDAAAMTLPKDKNSLYYALFALSVGIPLISSSFGWLGLIPLAVALFLIQDEFSSLEEKSDEIAASIKTLREECSEQIGEISRTTTTLEESLRALELRVSSLPTSERTERIIERIEGKRQMPIVYASIALMCVAALFAYRALDKRFLEASLKISQAREKISLLETHLSSTNIRVAESLSKIRETLDSHVKRLELINVKGEAQNPPPPSTVSRENTEALERAPKTKIIRSPSDVDKAQLGISPASSASASLPFRSFKEGGE